MQEVGPGVYVETGFQGSNVGLIVTDEGSVLIDSPMMPWDTRRWADTVEQVAGDSVRFLINTDHHPEHSLGNQFFPVPVIGHELGWKEITGYSDAFRQRLIDSLQIGDAERDAELKALSWVPPKLTLTNRLMLHLADKAIQLIHVGGHASSSILVYLRNEKILFSGDVVVRDTHPVLAQANSSDWLNALNRVRRMSFEVLVPGQGQPGDKELTVPVSDFVRSVRFGVRRHYRAGHSKAETYNQLLKLVDSFPVEDGKKEKTEQQFKAGINQIYEEIKAERGG
jgi:cyclase